MKNETEQMISFLQPRNTIKTLFTKENHFLLTAVIYETMEKM